MSAMATNGAGLIHDFEIALGGATSEDVDAALGPGRFGMAEETGTRPERGARTRRRDAASASGQAAASLARSARSSASPRQRVRRRPARLAIPVTVHVALGTDIIHMHPAASGAALGEGSLRDFRYFTSSVCRLKDGVYLNCGSAVVLPEVFLKAVALARNRGHRPDRADDREPGLHPALPAADQRRAPADRGRRSRILARRPSRAADPAAGGVLVDLTGLTSSAPRRR